MLKFVKQTKKNLQLFYNSLKLTRKQPIKKKTGFFLFTLIPFTKSESAPAPVSRWPGLQNDILIFPFFNQAKILYEKGLKYYYLI